MPNGIKGMITTPKGTVTTQHSTEQLRINGIKDLFAMFGGKHHGLQTECVEDAGCTIDQAKDRLLALMGKNATPSQKVRMPVTFMQVMATLLEMVSVMR